jgi:Cu/Ag efflux pump CusA
MWIVQIALRRPYTFIVMALLILLSTPLALTKMATDIFPEINIPVVSVIWQYGGLSAQEMGQRIASSTERSLTTTVNDIEHIESQSLAGIHRHQDLLPARSQYPDRARAGGGDQPGADQAAPAGRYSRRW